ncbi:MAG: HD domain-containing phosphohydrolase [Candidatus Omnitrophota bacterium]|jgi:HD-GYP domain-containing protein (c-di-GMP phosphodiesterase class II)
MPIDYKKELETAAKNMILVHEPDVLIKMIIRMLVQKAKVKHAGMLLHNRDKDTYILAVSRGIAGLKIPMGFARMDADNPLIRFFRQRLDKKFFSNGAIIHEEAQKVLKKKIGDGEKELLSQALAQMEIFGAVVCIPNYFRDELVGLVLLGAKKNGRRFAEEEIDFFLALASDVAMAIRNAQLFRELELELKRKHQLFLQTTIALAAAIDAKDHYTHGHTGRVTNLSLDIARRLAQENKELFDEKSLENLHIAALLHDIGKIGIPESLLNKEGPLSGEERQKMEGHPLVGAIILQPIRDLQEATLGVKYHHERYDGLGYPEKLKAEEIPLSAAIIAVADSFDAMITDRPYRKGLSKEEAIAEIKRARAKQFNPRVVDAFLELYQEGKI